jgi:hypothetical protein
MMLRVTCAAGFFIAMTGSALSPAGAAVTISSKITQNMNCVSGVCTPTAKDAILNVNDLTTMLANGNVEVNTGSGKLAKKIEDIVISDGFSWASSNSLTLDAYRSIAIDKAVSDAGSGAVVLTTDDGGSLGTLSFGPKGSLSFLSPSNSLTIDGSAYTLANSVSALAADIAANASGNYALSASYNAKQDGTYHTAPVATTFEGTFNGLGNTISHLSIHGMSDGLNLGLFAEIGTTGTVDSIRLTNAAVVAKANSIVGVLAGVNYGTIFGSFVEGLASGYAGKEEGLFGGLVGSNLGTLDLTGASVAIDVRGKSQFAAADLGGLVANNDGTIKQSYATGAVTASSGVKDGPTSGGLVGFNAESGPFEGIIDNCYATGAASVGANGYVGGLVGGNAFTVSNSYSEGAPIGGAGSYIGGSLGFDQSADFEGTLTGIYWDTTTSGITNLSQGAGNIANDPGITGETSAQLQAGLPTGFDPTIWAESPSINNGLPYLIANPPQ